MKKKKRKIYILGCVSRSYVKATSKGWNVCFSDIYKKEFAMVLCLFIDPCSFSFLRVCDDYK